MEELTKLLSEWKSIPSIYDASTVSTNTPFGINVAKSLNWIQAIAKKMVLVLLLEDVQNGEGFVRMNLGTQYEHIVEA